MRWRRERSDEIIEDSLRVEEEEEEEAVEVEATVRFVLRVERSRLRFRSSY